MKNFSSLAKAFSGIVILLLALAVYAQTRQPFYSSAPGMVFSGISVTAADGTVTNTYPTAYSSPPKVVVAQVGSLNSPTNLVVTLTTTNFVYNGGRPSMTNLWISIGTP